MIVTIRLRLIVRDHRVRLMEADTGQDMGIIHLKIKLMSLRRLKILRRNELYKTNKR
jgi:hypothetical protein